MAERLGEALLELRTDDRGLDKGIDRAHRRAGELGVRFDVVAKKALKLGRNLAIAAAGAATGFAVLIKNHIDHADAMSKSARRAGVMTEALSELAWAGELSDVSLDKITTGLQRLSYNMGQAASGADKTLGKAFKQLGIDITDANGQLRSADAVLLDLAESFAAMPAGADKTALAMRIFGRAGGEMITLLDNGKTGLREMAQEARGLGVVISTEMGQRAEVFNDTLTRIKAGFQGIVTGIAADLLPKLQEFADWLNDPKVVEDAKAMARGVVEAMGWIADAVRGVVELLRTLGDWWGKLRDVVEWASTHDMFGNELTPPALNPNIPMLEDVRNASALPDQAFDARFAGKTPKTEPEAKPAEPAKNPFKFADLTTSSGKTPAEEYADITAKAREFIATQEVERQALSLTEQAANALRYQHELLNEAKQADIDLSPDQEAALRRLAEQMAAAEAATGALANNLEFRRETFRGFFTDLKSGLQQGKGFWESFRDAALNAVGRITDRLLDQLLDALDQVDLKLSGIGGKGGGGFLGGLGSMIGSLFSGFFAKGGLIPDGSFGIVGENGPEPVIGTSRGAAVLPNSALGRVGGGSEVSIIVGLDMDSAGNIVPAIRKVSQEEIGRASPAIRAAAVGDVGDQMGGLLDSYSRRSA